MTDIQKFHVGDRVFSDRFGLGAVTKVNWAYTGGVSKYPVIVEFFADPLNQYNYTATGLFVVSNEIDNEYNIVNLEVYEG